MGGALNSNISGAFNFEHWHFGRNALKKISLNILDKKEKEKVAFTRYGERLTNSAFTAFRSTVVKDGKSNTIEIDLTRSFDLSMPTEYTVKAEFTYKLKSGEFAKVKIENIAFSVNEPAL